MHSVYNHDDPTSAFPLMGTDIPFENVSGSVRTVGDTVRPSQRRDTSGQYRSRMPRLVGTGTRDWGRDVEPDRKSHDGADAAHHAVNHLLDCPACTGFRSRADYGL